MPPLQSHPPRFRRRTALFALPALLCALLFTATAARADEIAWSKDFTKAVAQAKKTNKLVMVDFYTDWCGWCKTLDKKTYPDKTVVALTKARFIPVKINAEKEGRAAAAKYSVRSYPMILFIDGDGNIAGRIGGYAPPAPFAEQMKKIADSAKAFPSANAAFKKNPNNVANAAKITDLYANRGDAKHASAAFAYVKKNDPNNAQGYLAKSANNIGDLYQATGDLDKAVPYFQEAARSAKTSGDAAYAHMSIAACFMQMRDTGRAVSALKTGLANRKVTASDKKEMQTMLNQINGTAAKTAAR